MYFSFYIHSSIFTDDDNSSWGWKLEATNIDSTIYPLLTLFKFLKIKPFQKVLSNFIVLVAHNSTFYKGNNDSILFVLINFSMSLYFLLVLNRLSSPRKNLILGSAS